MVVFNMFALLIIVPLTGVCTVENKIQELYNQKRSLMYKTSSNGKILCYMSKGVHKNFNCRLKDSNNEKIGCTRIATAFVSGKFGKQGKLNFSDIETLQKMQVNSEYLFPDPYPTMYDGKKPRRGFYFGEKGIGNVIQRVIKSQKAEACPIKTYFFSTCNHIMGIEVSVSDEYQEIKLVVYDPNDTIRVRRILISSFRALESLTLLDLLGDERFLASYSLKTMNDSSDSCAGCLLSNDIVNNFDDVVIDVEGNCYSPAIFYLMSTCGHFGHPIIPLTLNEFRQSNSELEYIIRDKDQYKTAVLYIAMCHGHLDSVIHCVNIIQASKLKSEKDLLAAKTSRGYSCLYVAMEAGYDQCVIFFVQTVLNNKRLSFEEKKDLLIAQNYFNGYVGFYAAIRFNHISCVKGFIESILKSNLNSQEKLDILCQNVWLYGEIENGSIFWIMLADDYSNCANSCLKVIAQSKLDNKEKKYCSAAKILKVLLAFIWHFNEKA